MLKKLDFILLKESHRRRLTKEVKTHFRRRPFYPFVRGIAALMLSHGFLPGAGAQIVNYGATNTLSNVTNTFTGDAAKSDICPMKPL